MRDQTILLRLTEDEKKQIETAAKDKHLSTAVYVRQTMLKASKEK
jgi:uncharacterized protein (DUF1778 family)